MLRRMQAQGRGVYGMELLYRAGFSLGALSLALFLLGHAGLFTTPYLTAAAFAAASFFAASAIQLRRRISNEAFEPFSGVEKLLIASISVTIMLILPLAVLPPSVRDELIQHLALPKLYLSRQSIHQISFMGFSYLPQGVGVLYAIPLSLGADFGARFIHLGFSILTGLAVFLYLRDITGRVWGLLGMLIYISTPLVFNLSRIAYVDGGAAFFSTLGLIAALKYNDEPSAKWLLYAAISTGLALSAKYNTIASFILLGAFIAYGRARSGGNLNAVKSWALFVLVSVLVLSPWLIRNYAWTGSPLFPLYESAVKAAVKGEGFHVTTELSPIAKRLILYGEGASDLIMLPLRVFYEGQDNSIAKFDGVLNPLYLFFLPLAFIKRRRGLAYLGAFSILFFVMTFFTIDLVTRYVLPIIPVVVILVTLGVKNAFGDKRWLMAAGASALIAVFVFDGMYAMGLYKRYRPFAYLSGKENRDAYLARVLPEYPCVSFANGNLPEASRVMLLFAGDRGYYWDREYYYGDRLGNQIRVFVMSSADEDVFAEKFSSLGLTHILINERLFEKYVNDNFKGIELARIAGFFNTHTRRLRSCGEFALYEIRRPALPPR